MIKQQQQEVAMTTQETFVYEKIVEAIKNVWADVGPEHSTQDIIEMACEQYQEPLAGPMMPQDKVITRFSDAWQELSLTYTGNEDETLLDLVEDRLRRYIANMAEYSANCELKAVGNIRMLPMEFESTQMVVNQGDASEWMLPIFQEAKALLSAKLADGGPTDRKASPDCYTFTMKQHNFLLTQEMATAGWRQWKVMVQTRSKEDCAKEGVKYRLFRYPVHFWTSPDGEIIWGKIKLQGKFIP